jgi:cyclic pyranopterin phosphate synthase
MKDFNDDEIIDFVELTRVNDITIRFIELMPFDSHQIWKTGKFYRAEKIVNDLKLHYNTLKPITGSSTEHYIFKIDNYKGRVAVIPSYTRSLCGACNRMRITADGNLLNCLYSQSETNIRDAIRNGISDSGIKELIRGAMQKKLKDGWIAQNQGKDSRESMTQIGG